MTTPILFSIFHYLLSFYLLAVILRWYLPLTQADYYNPLSQFIIRITQPALFPLRRLIPSVKGIDTACIALILLVQSIEIIAILLLVKNSTLATNPLFVNVPLITLVVAGLARIAVVFFTTIFYTLIISAVISWINPQQLSQPSIRLLTSLPAPFLRPIRKWVPPLGGIDFTPMILGFTLIYASRLGHALALNTLPSAAWFQLIVHPLDFIR